MSGTERGWEVSVELRDEAIQAAWETGLFGCANCPEDADCAACRNDMALVVDAVLSVLAAALAEHQAEAAALRTEREEAVKLLRALADYTLTMVGHVPAAPVAFLARVAPDTSVKS